jgi:hypothetical protein
MNSRGSSGFSLTHRLSTSSSFFWSACFSRYSWTDIALSLMMRVRVRVQGREGQRRGWRMRLSGCAATAIWVAR